MFKVGRIAKAIVSGASAGLAALYTAMGDNVVTTGEGVTIALAVLGALGITYVVPNAAQSEQRQR
ncbi:hypothetical protein FLW53_23555 [Microbispora sp. SCL1-1]|uniref:hypothetical protein n=1 Tax=unclassified Microbispora TaxID=2614687 RepID=UPI00115A84BB|nr:MULTISPECIES: hypothetical protein [unclassified Microbispora]NJP27122.1 hypothetical protein [Microbispora sp. CL1-1]TQS11467.1 hypothetical protein FLW53_23555 [Microbispora sp. SCL1-1]